MKKPTAKTKPGKGSAQIKGVRPLSPEKIALTRAKHLREIAQYGNGLDKQVTDFLTAYYAGNYPLTDPSNGVHLEFDEDGEQTGESEHCALRPYGASKTFDEHARQLLFPPALVPILFAAILRGDAKKLRNIAAAVERVHARKEFKAGKRTFKPAKPEKLATLANAQSSGTVRMSGKDIAAPGMSERTGQRVARLVGVKPAKPGRKKKLLLDTPTPKKKPHSAAVLHREVESGAKAFWAKRKSKK